jgi:hypothetical protein
MFITITTATITKTIFNSGQWSFYFNLELVWYRFCCIFKCNLLWHWEIRVVSCELWAVSCELWDVSCEMWVVSCELWVVSCELWVVRLTFVWKFDKASITCTCKHLSDPHDRGPLFKQRVSELHTRNYKSWVVSCSKKYFSYLWNGQWLYIHRLQSGKK